MSFRLSLNEEVAAALNEQICIESSAAFLYFSMASWASVRGLTGMAKWFRTEATGELTHMGLFVDYLNDRDYRANFQQLKLLPLIGTTQLQLLIKFEAKSIN